jgi:hypothetical protein
MTSSTLHFNQSVFKKKFEQYIDSDRRIKGTVDKFATKVFTSAKTKLIQDFENSAITQELKQGPQGDNISQTLGGYGNLFAFLGFFDNQNPTEELENLLMNISMGKMATRKGNTVYYKVKTPDKSEVEDATRLNWGTNSSWAEGVESGDFAGDADLSHFIYTSWVNGRSKEGLQVQGQVRESEFEPKPYLSAILANFRERINGGKV